MLKTYRYILATILAPLLVPGYFVVTSKLGGYSIHGDLIFFSTLFAYLGFFLVGVPVLAVLSHSKKLNIVNASLLGVIGGALFAVLLSGVGGHGLALAVPFAVFGGLVAAFWCVVGGVSLAKH